MPPIWFCLECERVAYGWAMSESCIYCESPRVRATDEVYFREPRPTDYRLLFVPPKQWAELEAESARADKSPRELIAERENAPVERIRDEPVQHGKLILLRIDREHADAH